MPSPQPTLLRSLRTLLVLGRVSNLPTVWSNCLAGWILGGAGDLSRLTLVCLGATCLYLGGMFLNDAFDVELDRRQRTGRPIPSGAITLAAVWRWGFFWLGAGALILILIGQTTGLLAVVLLLCIVLYDAVHKRVNFSPMLMAACRFLLYLLAASTGDAGVDGLVLWSALALAAYITGLSHLARRESTRSPFQYWPCVSLAAPMLLAWIVSNAEYRTTGLWLALALAVWIASCLGHLLERAEPDIAQAVSGLLAGIVLVDLLAVGAADIQFSAVFVLLFVAAWLGQRFIPAT